MFSEKAPFFPSRISGRIPRLRLSFVKSTRTTEPRTPSAEKRSIPKRVRGTFSIRRYLASQRTAPTRLPPLHNAFLSAIDAVRCELDALAKPVSRSREKEYRVEISSVELKAILDILEKVQCLKTSSCQQTQASNRRTNFEDNGLFSRHKYFSSVWL